MAADEGVSEVAVEAQGSMADEGGLSHEVATAVAIVEVSVVHPEALRPTKRWLSKPFQREFQPHGIFKVARGFAGYVMESPARTALPVRRDRDNCFCLWRIGLKGGKGQASPSHYST